MEVASEEFVTAADGVSMLKTASGGALDLGNDNRETKGMK